MYNSTWLESIKEKTRGRTEMWANFSKKLLAKKNFSIYKAEFIVYEY